MSDRIHITETRVIDQAGGLLQYGAPPEQPRAWEDNTIVGSWSRGVIIAREAIESGELSAAVVWPTGTGNYAVNGWRS